MPKQKQHKVSASDKPSAENNYLFDQRVQRVKEKRGCSLEEAENIVSEIIQKDHPDWNPPTTSGKTLNEIAEEVKSTEAVAKPASAPKKKPTKAQDAEEGFLTTNDLAGRYGVTTTSLRRVLRDMPMYNDGTFTRYRWNGWDDPAILLIDKEMNKKAQEEASNSSSTEVEEELVDVDSTSE